MSLPHCPVRTTGDWPGHYPSNRAAAWPWGQEKSLTFTKHPLWVKHGPLKELSSTWSGNLLCLEFIFYPLHVRELRLRGKENHPSSYRRKAANKRFELGQPVSQPELKILLHGDAASYEHVCMCVCVGPDTYMSHKSLPFVLSMDTTPWNLPSHSPQAQKGPSSQKGCSSQGCCSTPSILLCSLLRP